MKPFLLTLITLALVTVSHAQDSVTTLAGQPQVPGATNGTGTNALFNEPAGIVVAANGTIYVADSANHAIRTVATNGLVSTFAGQLGVPGIQNGTGTNAQFNAPSGLTFDLKGNLLVSDTGNATIRQITPTGSVTTIAGVAGQSGFLDGAAGTALFGSPLGLAVATNGNIYIVDSGNHVIRLLTNGVVSTLAGNPNIWGSADGQGANALFNAPCGIALDSHGNLWVSDTDNDTIRKVTPAGLVTTYAGLAAVDGTNDGPVATARFCRPAELTFDPQGNLLVADSFNHTLRKIGTNGIVSTISGSPGASGSTDGLNGQGRYFNPYGLAFNPNGRLLVADTYNELIRQVLVPYQETLQLTGHPATLTLTWTAVVGQQYQVQYTGNLAGTWTNLSPILTATSHTLTQTDILSPTQPQKHYRVVLWP
jgi:sugar lactone lactonase YvrE